MTRTNLRAAEVIRRAARDAARGRYEHADQAAGPDFKAAEERTLDRLATETGASAAAVVVLAAARLVIEGMAAQALAEDSDSELGAAFRALAAALWAPEVTRPGLRFALQGDDHRLVAAAAAAATTPWADRAEAAEHLVTAADHTDLGEYLGEGWIIVHGLDLLSIYGERVTAADKARRAVVAMLAPALSDDGGRQPRLQRQDAAAAAAVSRPTLNGWLARGKAPE